MTQEASRTISTLEIIESTYAQMKKIIKNIEVTYEETSRIMSMLRSIKNIDNQVEKLVKNVENNQKSILEEIKKDNQRNPSSYWIQVNIYQFQNYRFLV